MRPAGHLAAADDRVALPRRCPGPVRAKGTSFSAGPASRAARTASAPMKPVSSLQHQPRPASIGSRSSHQVVAVEVEADLEAQRVARAEAGRRRARGARSASHTAPASSGCEQQLDAVLARVAGAADEHPARRRRCAGGGACAAGSRPSASACDDLARPRPLHGEHRVVVEAVLDLGVEVLGVALEPRQVLLVVGRVGDGQEAVLGEAVGEEVVEDAAVLAAQHASTARRPRGSAATSLDSRRWSRASAPAGPRVSISPMCETSNTPAAPRTATCSSRMPAYCTGISQPAKGTSRAPAASWRSYERGALRGSPRRARFAADRRAMAAPKPAKRRPDVRYRSRRNGGMSISSSRISSDERWRSSIARAAVARRPRSLPRAGRARRAAAWSKPVAMTVTRTSSPRSVVDDRAEDDVRVRVGGALDDLGRLVDLEQAEVAAAGDVEQDAGGALDGLLEQRRARSPPWRPRRRGSRRSPCRCPSAPSRRRS